MSLVSFELRNGLMLNVRIGVGAVEGAARRLPQAEAVLESQIPSLECFARAAEAAAQTVEPSEPSDEEQQYKRELVRTVVLRALQKAVKTA
jgi:carbon-monoxide dehydrogenase medium subunit